MSSPDQHGFNASPDDARVHEVINDVYDASLRLVSSRYHTVVSLAWAAEQLHDLPEKALGVDSAPSRRVAVAALRHLSAQRAALDEAYEQLAGQDPKDPDNLHQAYSEWLTGLARNDRWMTEDNGVPSVDAALRSLRSRDNQRRIDGIRRDKRIVLIGEDADPSFADSGDAPANALEDSELDAFVRARLGNAERVKWDRFRAWAIDGVPQEELARRYGMKPATLRKEITRFKERLGRILEERRGGEGGDGDDAVPDGPREDPGLPPG